MRHRVFGYAIASARIDKGITQKELAVFCGVTHFYICKIERGRILVPPSDAVLAKIAECLKLNYEELLIGAGKIDKEALREAAQEDIRIARLLRRIQSGKITRAQLEAIAMILD